MPTAFDPADEVAIAKAAAYVGLSFPDHYLHPTNMNNGDAAFGVSRWCEILVVSDSPLAEPRFQTPLNRLKLVPIFFGNVSAAVKLGSVGYQPGAILLFAPLGTDAACAATRNLVKVFTATPIVVVGAIEAHSEILALLSAGATDVVVVPICPAQLGVTLLIATERARARAVSERTLGALSVDIVAERVTCNGKRVVMAAQVFKCLRVLLEHIDELVTFEVLGFEAWGHTVVNDTRTYHVHVSELRQILRKHGVHGRLYTVRGKGYMLSTRTLGEDTSVNQRKELDQGSGDPCEDGLSTES
jgi:DNA-binding response OmpR family regulator